MANKFDLKAFTGKKQIYVKLTNLSGVCKIYDWSDKKLMYVQRLEGLKYYTYKKVNGRQVSKTFEDLNEAKRWRSSPDIFHCDSKFKELTFTEVTKRFFEHNSNKWKITTKELYESYLKHFDFFSSLAMNQINSYAVDEWLRRLKSSEYLSALHNTRVHYQNELTLLKQICTFYSEYMDESYVHPCKKRHNADCIVSYEKYRQAKERSKIKHLSMDDCKNFLSELKKDAQRKEAYWVFYYLATFQLLSGCRIGEICALNWSDIDWQKSQVRVSKTVQWARNNQRETLIGSSTKTGRERIVTLPVQLIQALQKWRQMQDRSVGLVFSPNPFHPLGYRSIQFRYNKAFSGLGLPFRSTHIMRHSFATHWLTHSGGAIQSLQRQLGHSSPEQTLHYAKITDELTQEGLSSFESGMAQVVSISSFSGEKNESWLGEAGCNDQNLIG